MNPGHEKLVEMYQRALEAKAERDLLRVKVELFAYVFISIVGLAALAVWRWH